MVEMLGVLAIIGVLSVGGISAYGVAMKKHKANELLHQASMLATTISAKIQSKGELPQSIENFGDAKYGTFKKPEKANDEQFEMKITDMDSAVCEQMEKMAGGMVRKAECNDSTLTLTYNNNLSSEKVAADYNGDPNGCEDSGRKYCDNDTCISATDTCPSTVACNGHGYKDSNDDCVCDPGYSGTDCATEACTTGTYCGSGATKECCATDEVCTTSGDVAGTCVKNSSGCTTNGSCIGQTVGATTCTSENCYCKLETTDYDCSAPNKGTCTTLDADRETTYTDPNDTTKTKTFLVSSGGMSWWAADNWCKAHDMKLVSYNTAHNLFDCDKDNYSCTWSKFTTSSYWDNGTLPDYYWTAESYNSCNAWFVNVYTELFDYNGRYIDYYYALCE
jgi:type II secretory pathway pseudopilin PulG